MINKFPKKGPVIAIDGPAGTGKSSTTKRLCEELGFVHIDTGAIYRAVAYLLMLKGVKFALGTADSKRESPDLDMLATREAQEVEILFSRVQGLNPANRVFANGADITDKIRTPEVSLAASRVSRVPEVRSALLDFQRKLGALGNTVLEGRDIGTVVFPDADIKFFLTANADERTKRRLDELEAAGKDVPKFEELKKQIEQRDYDDANRPVAPLKCASEAIEIDTSDLTLDEVVDQMKKIALLRLEALNRDA